ncbi:MAG: hypothetical protein JO256_03785 [Alphaproteobacteria bacterium]|nr:hypothetical protein [Alphaproteobacteria bacterium]
MEFHKPKPVHSWRELLTEIGVIVIGVAIALAAEQGVEWLHWRAQVQESRQAIAAEMAQNIGSAIVAWRSGLCAENRLDEIAAILDKAQETGSLPPVGDIGVPSTRVWRTGTWESMVASQVVTHFPREELTLLADIYALIHLVNDAPDPNAWTDLDDISGPGRRLDPASLADLRRSLGRARTLARRRAFGASLIIERTKTLHLPFNAQDLKLIALLRRLALESNATTVPKEAEGVLRGGFSICRPIGTVPPHYGQSSYNLAPPLTDERLKSLPPFGDTASSPAP